MLDKNGRDGFYADLHWTALIGGDCLTLWGRGRQANQAMYIWCQCSIVYRSSKVDKATRIIVQCSDGRNVTYCNDHKNQQHGLKGRNASDRSGLDCRLSKDEGHCSFSLALFQDEILLHKIHQWVGVAPVSSSLPWSSPLFNLSSCTRGSPASRRPKLRLCQIRDSSQSSLCLFWLPRYPHPSFLIPDYSSLQEEILCQKW
jgi:hypothetical protein